MTRTPRQLAGDDAEGIVAARLNAAGWHVLARQVRIGRNEIDILAVDPGPPGRLVAVEVRRRGRRDFGLPEETFDHRKRARVRRALLDLVAAGAMPDGHRLPRLAPSIDLAVVEPAGSDGHLLVRHHRSVDATG